MLEDLWSARVKGDQSRVELVNRVASHMADEEVLEAPLAIADDLPPRAVDELVAGGILRREASTVMFVHQSLFDFARARAFAIGNVSLVDYVMARQGGLFLRPLLWSSLTYLRGAHANEYKRTFTELWQRPGTRLHVRVLLAEFLGQLEDPDADELEWVDSRLDDVAIRRAALAAMQGSAAWFDRLKGATLPRALQAVWKLDVVGLLCGAASFAPSRVVELLEEHWSLGVEERRASVHVLRFLGAWDERAVAYVARLLVGNDGARFDLDGVLAAVVELAPKLAPRVIAAVVGGALNQAEAEVTANPPTSEFEIERRYQAALRCGEGLVDLTALAQHTPTAYLDAVFPVFVHAAELLAVPGDGASYRHAPFGLADDHAGRFADAIAAAVVRLSRETPDAFLAFARAVGTSDLMPVHHVLARAYAALPTSRRSASLEYLQADDRRLRIGTGTKPDNESVALLDALSPTLLSDDVHALEVRIHQSYLYEPVSAASPSEKRARLTLNRAHRARLLRSLPHAKLSTESRLLISSEYTKGDAPRAPRGYDCGAIGSPMSTDQMARAKDEHLLGLFALLTDDTEWRHPRRDLEGGSIEASRALGELAKRDPDRVAALLAQLTAVTQERPVAYALTGLAEIGWRTEEWERLVLACDSRGFRSEEFRWQVASAIARRAQNESGASDALCALLECWLGEGGVGEEDSCQEEREKAGADPDKPRAPRSLLFGMSGGGPLPRGSYPALHALFCGFMFRSPPHVERFLSVIEGQLTRRDPSVIWYWLCFDLRYLSLSEDRARAERFIRALFDQYPDVLRDEAGALLVAHSICWVGKESVRDWIQVLRGAPTATGRQAAGELLVLASSLGVELDLEERLASRNASVDESIGIAFAAAHLWYEDAFRQRGTATLLQLFADDEIAVREIALGVFRQCEELPVDNDTRRLVDAVINDADLTARIPDDIFEALHVMLPSDAERVATLIRRFLDAVESGKRIESSWVTIGPELMRAAVTLQRLPPFRETGMAIFERLLTLGAHGIDEVLFDLDARPRRAPPRSSPRTRFRARRANRRRR